MTAHVHVIPVDPSLTPEQAWDEAVPDGGALHSHRPGGVGSRGVRRPRMRPHRRGVMTALRFNLPWTVESVVHTRTNGPLIAAAAAIWIRPTDWVVDMTYGLGRFWTDYQPANLTAHDIDPAKGDGVDFRDLPHPDATVDVAVFDPPYIAQGGRDTSTIPAMLGRYGLDTAPKSVAELEALLADGIEEAARVLTPSGRLLVKCMDYVNGGRFVKGRHHVVATAECHQLEQVDEFVHHSGLGPQPPGRAQLHSRRSHSFLCVFQKPPVWRKSVDREVVS